MAAKHAKTHMVSTERIIVLAYRGMASKMSDADFCEKKNVYIELLRKPIRAT